SGYTQANEALAAFTERVGRRKLIMPIYTALVQTEPGLVLAKEIFARARPGYHPITTGSVETLIADARPAPAPPTPPAAPEAPDAPEADP
ncbi:leukotriene A4 hydrolase C-terminal domain-containing protein, partial [Pantoea sp. SIMBA_079]